MYFCVVFAKNVACRAENTKTHFISKLQQNIFFLLFLLQERLEENAGWQAGCQGIPNSSIRTSHVQVSKVSHNMVIDLPLKGLQVVLRRKDRAG